MQKAFKQTQTFLNKIQSSIKQKLEQIQSIDHKCLQIQVNLQTMRQQYLKDLIHQQYDQDINNSCTQHQTILESIRNIEVQLKNLTEQKIKIAEELQNQVSQISQKINQQINEAAEERLNIKDFQKLTKSQQLYSVGFKKQKGRQKNINPEIKSIMKEYLGDDLTEINEVFDLKKKQDSKYCICTTSKILICSGDMIECQNVSCPIGWYHFQCVQINPLAVPTTWLCDICIEDQTIKKKNKKTSNRWKNHFAGKKNQQVIIIQNQQANLKP